MAATTRQRQTAMAQQPRLYTVSQRYNAVLDFLVLPLSGFYLVNQYRSRHHGTAHRPHLCGLGSAQSGAACPFPSGPTGLTQPHPCPLQLPHGVLLDTLCKASGCTPGITLIGRYPCGDPSLLSRTAFLVRQLPTTVRSLLAAVHPATGPYPNEIWVMYGLCVILPASCLAVVSPQLGLRVRSWLWVCVSLTCAGAPFVGLLTHPHAPPGLYWTTFLPLAGVMMPCQRIILRLPSRPNTATLHTHPPTGSRRPPAAAVQVAVVLSPSTGPPPASLPQAAALTTMALAMHARHACTHMEGRASWVHLGLFLFVSLLSTLLLPTVYPLVAMPWWTLPLLALSALASLPSLAQAQRRAIPNRPLPRLPKARPSSAEARQGGAQPPAPPDSRPVVHSRGRSSAAQPTSSEVARSEWSAVVTPGASAAVRGAAPRETALEAAAVSSVGVVPDGGGLRGSGVALPAPRHSAWFAAADGVGTDGSSPGTPLLPRLPATEASERQQGGADAGGGVTAAGVARPGAEQQQGPHTHSLSSGGHGVAVSVIRAPAPRQPPAPSLGSELDELRRLVLGLRERPYVSRFHPTLDLHQSRLQGPGHSPSTSPSTHTTPSHSPPVQAKRYRVVTKIPHMEPHQLPPDFLQLMAQSLSQHPTHPSLIVGVAMKSGCIELVLDVVAITEEGSGAGAGAGADADPAQLGFVDPGTWLHHLHVLPPPGTEVLTQACGSVWKSTWDDSLSPPRWLLSPFPLPLGKLPRLLRAPGVLLLLLRRTPALSLAARDATSGGASAQPPAGGLPGGCVLQLELSVFGAVPDVCVRRCGAYVQSTSVMQGRGGTSGEGDRSVRTFTAPAPVKICGPGLCALCVSACRSRTRAPAAVAVAGARSAQQGPRAAGFRTLALRRASGSRQECGVTLTGPLPSRGLLMLESKLGWMVSDSAPLLLTDDADIAAEVERLLGCGSSKGHLAGRQASHSSTICTTGAGHTREDRAAHHDLITDLGAWFDFLAVPQPPLPEAAFNPQTMRMEVTSFSEVLFNPVAQDKFVHTVSAGYVLGSMFVLSISAWYLLRGRNVEFAKRSMTVAASFGLAAALSVVVLGDASGYTVSENQKMKMAAIEAMWHTEPAPASFTLVGFPDVQRRTTHFAFRIPWVMGLIGTHSVDETMPGIAELVDAAKGRIGQGVKAYDAMLMLRQDKTNSEALATLAAHDKDMGYALLLKRYVDDPRKATPADIQKAADSTIPNVPVLFWSFRVMVGCGLYFIALFGFSFWKASRRQLDTQRWYLRLALWSLPLPWVAIELGWIVAEYGRQPWAIEGVLPTALGVSSVTQGQVLSSLAGFVVFYTALAIIDDNAMFDYATLRVIWWALLGTLLIGFAIMDGFDFGVAGLLKVLGRDNEERLVLIEGIEATWEGNQVWFILAGGATFAAWPMLYAVSFSGMYLAIFLVLLAFILRPVGFNFRGKVHDPRWASAWDWVLVASGVVVMLIAGVA
ncbi:MAG: hypothetical protein WDW38_007217 [Sanguina aurantia]